MKLRYGLLIAALGAGAMLLPAAVAGQGGSGIRIAADDPTDFGPLVPEGDAPDLALIYTGGVVGYVEPCG